MMYGVAGEGVLNRKYNLLFYLNLQLAIKSVIDVLVNFD